MDNARNGAIRRQRERRYCPTLFGPIIRVTVPHAPGLVMVALATPQKG
jgi:hypothetical protein